MVVVVVVVVMVRGVNPGGLEDATPQILGWGGRGCCREVRRGPWTGLGKYYSLFQTESKFKVIFSRKKETNLPRT